MIIISMKDIIEIVFLGIAFITLMLIGVSYLLGAIQRNFFNKKKHRGD